MTMKSYALAVALAMLLAATYAFQNTGEILVRFLIWERTIPQGIWDVLLFAAGGVLMWLVSLFALLETRGKYVRQIREKDKRIRELEEERTSLMNAFRTQQEPKGPVEEVTLEPVKPVDDTVQEEGDERKTDPLADLNERIHPSGEDEPSDEPGEDLSDEQEDETKGV
jgi:uncharacterized integral membrane protein